jgi:hypothetical protein
MARVWVGKREVEDKTATFESVNEIHAFGLYDKRRTRHRGEGRKKFRSQVAAASRCGKKCDRSLDVNR